MNKSAIGFLVLILATISLFWVVPALPFAHLDDPSHWGVIGYGVVFGLVVAKWLQVGAAQKRERRVMVALLVAMPLIYVANWLRFGGENIWLLIELIGTLIYWSVAFLAAKRFPWVLAPGIAAHALWDLWHYGQGSYVPDWYVIGCIIIDVSLGFYVWTQFKNKPE